MPGPGESVGGTQAIARAIALLREISTFGRDGARAIDLIRRCKFEYPTAHRILKALVDEQVIRKDLKTRRYFLGQLVYELSLGAEPRVDLRRDCDAMTSALAEASGDTVFLYIRSGWDVVCVDRKEGSFPIRTFVFDIGSRRPLGIGAAGLAMLLSDSLEDTERILTTNSVRFGAYGKNVSVDQVMGMIERGREVGYVSIGDLVFPGIRAVSVPFRLAPGLPLVAVSIAAISSRMPRTRIPELVAMMEAEIRRLRKPNAT